MRRHLDARRHHARAQRAVPLAANDVGFGFGARRIHRVLLVHLRRKKHARVDEFHEPRARRAALRREVRVDHAGRAAERRSHGIAGVDAERVRFRRNGRAEREEARAGAGRRKKRNRDATVGDGARGDGGERRRRRRRRRSRRVHRVSVAAHVAGDARHGQKRPAVQKLRFRSIERQLASLPDADRRADDPLVDVRGGGVFGKDGFARNTRRRLLDGHDVRAPRGVGPAPEENAQGGPAPLRVLLDGAGGHASGNGLGV